MVLKCHKPWTQTASSNTVTDHRWGLYVQLLPAQPRPSSSRERSNPLALNKRAKYATRLCSESQSTRLRLCSVLRSPPCRRTQGPPLYTRQEVESRRRHAEALHHCQWPSSKTGTELVAWDSQDLKAGAVKVYAQAADNA